MVELCTHPATERAGLVTLHLQLASIPTVAMVELCTHLAIERARLVTSHLKLARLISIPTAENPEAH